MDTKQRLAKHERGPVVTLSIQNLGQNAEPKPPANAGVAALLNTSLGDLLVAGLVKDPEDAGRIIAAAITQAEARVAAPKARETDAEPAAKSEPQPGGEAKTPTDAIPQKLK